jgi:UDP-N-acetylglucosamine--N-acetylmuramyl-(pentapeptide) pyrophosphoryl-undecaprenol N-acetylglucosamine transferase
MSYGGSAILMNLVAIAVVLRIDYENRTLMRGGRHDSGGKCAHLIMAGGTGGHIFPGLAVAHALRAKGWRVHWLGAPDSMESRLVPPRGIALETIDFGGVRGKGAHAGLAAAQAAARFWQSIQVVRRVKPDVVVGLGGYISFPGGMMGVLLWQARWCCTSRTPWRAWPTRCWRAWPTVCSPPSRMCSRPAQWVGNPLRAAFCPSRRRPSALPGAAVR